MATFDGEESKNTQNKWRRGDSRGILSAGEEETLRAIHEGKKVKLNRHQRMAIHYKTRKAIADLSLIFSTKTEPIDMRPYTSDFYSTAWFDQYLKALLLFYYKQHFFKLYFERKSLTKVSLTERDVWQSVREDLRNIIASIQEDTKNERKLSKQRTKQLTKKQI